MDFLTLAKERYSVRSFKGEAVSEESIRCILEAAHVAPTARNLQPQKITVIRTPEALEKLKKCTQCHYHAPLAFLISYDKSLCWTREYDGKTSGDVDAAIVATHMMLEAASLGVGSTWVMFFDPAAVRREFSLEDNVEPVAILVMGYPADDAKPSDRHTAKRDDGEMVTFEK